MSTERIIGVDFGTSTSVVRVKRYKDGKPVDDKLETKAVTFNIGSTMVPTLIRKTENGTYYGYDAEVNKRNSTLYQSFKVYLESNDPAQKEEARNMTAEFLKYLGKVYREQSDGGHLGDSSDIEKTLISYPVKWSNETKEFMLASAKAAGFPNVSGMNEAEAAIRAVTLQNEELLKKKGYFTSGQPVNILLLDMGAGTTDLVLCKHTPGANPKTEILCTYPKTGDVLFGGREVDALLGQFIVENVSEEDRAIVMKKIGIAKYKSWKETVVSPELKKGNTVEEFAELENFIEDDFELSINRTSFEELAGDYLNKLPELVNGCLKEAKMSGSDIDLVILTGGHSQWYFVNDILCGKTAKFGDCGLTKIKSDNNRVISISRPQETVALGLVFSGIQEFTDTSEKKKEIEKLTQVLKNTLSEKDPANQPFEMKVNDVFKVSGRGTVAIGLIQKGSLRIGDTVVWNNPSGQKKSKVMQITMEKAGQDPFPTAVVHDNETVQAGMIVGLLLRGVSKNEINRGDILHCADEYHNMHIKNESEETAKTCKVRINRNYNQLGSALTYKVFVDGEKVSLIDNGKSVEIMTTPGTHTIYVNCFGGDDSNINSNIIHFQSEENKTICIDIYTTSGRKWYYETTIVLYVREMNI